MSYAIETTAPIAAKFLQAGDVITYRRELRLIDRVDLEDDHVRVYLSTSPGWNNPRFYHIFDCRAYDMIPFNGDIT